MESITVYIFWISLIIILHSYLLYAIWIWLYLKLFPNKKDENLEESYPSITVLVASYNESSYIQNKIDNLLALNYPKDKFKIAFVTDGSDDESNAIVQQNATINDRIKLFFEAERRGKQHAVNRVIPFIDSEIIVFNDCNTIVNNDALKHIAEHFSNPSVGVVSGEKKIIVLDKDKVVSSGEGLYWKYESCLKQLDSDFYSAIGSAGELFAIRKELYSIVPQGIAIEDFYLSMQIVINGYINRYEPRAYAEEHSSLSLKDEFKRKRRIASGAFATLRRLRGVYSFKHLRLAYLFFSHRFSRWTLAPICLILVFLSNLQLQEGIYSLFFKVQIIFYLMAALGFLMRNLKTRFKILYTPFYFVFMNVALFAGFWDHLRNRDNVVWEKVRRRGE